MPEATRWAPARLRFALAPRASRLLRARDRIRDYLTLYCCDQETIDDVVAAVEEACTNVIRHSGSQEEIEIRLGFRGDELEVLVKDRGCGFDVAAFDPGRVPDFLATGGRGLFMISRLCDEMELRREGGVEVRMIKRAVALRETLILESGLGDIGQHPHSAHRDTRLRALLEEIDEAFIALDWEYRCVHANEAALCMTGKALSELLGRRPWDLRPAFVDAPATSAMREAMELGRPSVCEFRSPADGSWYEARVYPTPAGMAAYFREISARKNIEAEREQLIAAKQESARLATALNEINDQIHSSLAVEEIMRRALEGAARALSADAGTIELREAGRWVVRLQHRLRKQDVGTSLAGADSPVASAATARGAPVAVADLAASEEMNGGFVRSRGLKSVLAVPFTVTGADVGVLLLYHKKRTHAFDGAEVDFAGLLGSSLSLALKNSHLYQAEQEAQRQARHELEISGVLLDASAVVAEWTELHPMLDRLGDVLLRSAAHSRVIIGLWDEACKQMTTVVSKGRHPIPLSTMRLDEMSPRARKMIKTRKSILIDYARARDDRLRELATQRLLRYALAVPVLARGRLVATITVDTPGENQAFSEREVALVQSVADQAAVAIDNARLVAAGQAELARTTLLKEIAAIGASTLDLEDLAQSALLTAQRLLGATTGILFVVDDAAGVLRSLANFGIAEEVLDEVRELPLGRETSGTRMALSGDLVTHYSDGVPDTAAHLRRVTGTAGSGWVIVPVKVRRKTLGTLGLSFATARPFLDDELALFQSLADQLGVAMDKARLFAAERELRERAERHEAALLCSEETARKAEERYRTLFNTLIEGFCIIEMVFDAQGAPVDYRFLEVNPVFEDDFGWQGARGKLVRELAPDHDAHWFEIYGRVALTGEPARFMAPATAAGRYYDVSAFRVGGAESREVGILFSDITQRKRAEAESQRLLTDCQAQAEELAGHAGLAEALNAIDNLVHSTLDFDEIMQRALDEGAQALDADAGTIEIREGSFWVVHYQHGLAGADAELRRPDMESPIARRTALRREPFTIADVKATAEVDAGFMRKHALRSVLAVPLLAHDAVGGCLLFYGKSPRVFGDSEIDFGRKLGATVSLAAESARLLRAQVEAQRRAEQELETTRLLLEAAESLAESLALSDILATLARIVLDVGGHARVTVSLWQEESGWLEVALSLGQSSLPHGVRIGLADLCASARRAIAERAAVTIDYDALQPGRRGFADAVPSRLALNVPLYSGKRLVGLLTTDDAGARKEFGEREVRLIEGVAAQAAVAIDNARLLAEVAQRERFNAALNEINGAPP